MTCSVQFSTGSLFKAPEADLKQPTQTKADRSKAFWSTHIPCKDVALEHTVMSRADDHLTTDTNTRSVLNEGGNYWSLCFALALNERVVISCRTEVDLNGSLLLASYYQIQVKVPIKYVNYSQ